MSLADWLPWVRAHRTHELSDELRAHLEMAEADFIARGEPPNDAAAHARREFGNVGLVQEISRDNWGEVGMWIERLWQDVRFALRILRKAPAFTTVAVLTVALGIGSTTAIFSVVNATLLRPLPYPHPEQLVRIEDDLLGVGAQDVGMSTPEWKDLQTSGLFEQVSPTWFDDNNLTGMSRPQRVGLLIVAPNYFALLGVKPQLGATFDPADGTPGFNGQAVISDGLWQRAFGKNANVLGRIVQLDSDSYRVVGVMPPGFQAPARTSQERDTEIWVAFGFAGAPLTVPVLRSPLFPGAIARIRSGLTLADAQRRIDVLVHSLRAQYPADYPPQSEWTIRLVPLKEHVVGDVRQSLLFLLAGVSVVLLIGCANVANLLLARASSRGREMAVRQALGGEAGRLARQLLTESIVTSLLGGIAGVVILLVSSRYLLRLAPPGLPRLENVTISWEVLLFGLAVSIVAGAFFGVAPSLHVHRQDMTRVLKQEGRASSPSREQARTRQTLVVVEVALSLVLMIAASLLLRSFWGLTHAPLGFSSQGVSVIRTRLPYPNDPKEDLYATAADEAPFVHELLQRLRTLPGVQEAALGSGSSIPLDHPEQDQNILRVVFEDRAAEQPTFVTGAAVTPEYFRLLGVPLLHGRLLQEIDTDKSPPVAVVNESMARRYWPNENIQNVIGKRLKLSPRAPAWTTIVGVVADARTEVVESARVPVLYASVYQRSTKHLAIYLRGHVAANAIEQQVRGALQSINSALPVFGATQLDDIVASALAPRRFAMQLIGAFALTALLLAGLGIYGVISYMVNERTHEIGVRLALGAPREAVMRLVLRQGVRLVVAGGALGVIIAVAVMRGLSGLLYGVSATDPITFGAVAGILIVVALAACYVPARRATRVDALIALRS
jgi:predicted permease